MCLAGKEPAGTRAYLDHPRPGSGVYQDSPGISSGNSSGLKKVDPPVAPVRRKYRSLSASYSNLSSCHNKVNYLFVYH